MKRTEFSEQSCISRHASGHADNVFNEQTIAAMVEAHRISYDASIQGYSSIEELRAALTE